MYQLIATQDKSIDETKKVEHIQTLDELLEEYSKTTDNIKNVSLQERLSILIDKVNSKEIQGLDSFSYVLQLRKILFTEEQRIKNIKVNLVRNNEPLDKTKIAMALAIITLNNNSLEEYEEQNKYYYYSPKQELIPITQEELKYKFDNGILEYIEKDSPQIPGIIENRGIKR
jgi:hypothetical protein